MACRKSSRIMPGSIKALHALRPFAVAMTGASAFDPVKD